MNSSLLFFFIFGCIIVTALALGIIYYIVIQKQRQVKEALERQQLVFDFKDALLRSRLEAQETTLSAVSLELHDSVNQMLTSGVSQFRLAEVHMQHPEGLKAIEEGRETIRRAIATIRSLSHSLHTGLIADMSLEEALQQELKRLNTSKAIQANLEVNGKWEPNSDARLIIFRIVQEALQNVLKHAKASEVTVRVDSTPDDYSLSISDNGAGFDTAAKPNEASLGLRSMRERVALLQGSFMIESAHASGTVIKLSIPINHERK